MVRAPYFDKNGIKKGAWSREEDDKLRDYIEKYGHWNWRELPKYAGLARCGKSCRLRWMNYLRPDVKHGNYTKEDEDLIIKLHQELGNKWSTIATKLPGRTDNEIKNHWHTHLKKRENEIPNQHNSDQMKEQSSADQTYRIPESLLANPILEISPLSLATSSNEMSCLSSDSGQVVASAPNIKFAPETNFASFDQTCGQFDGDFWTTPFVPDNKFNQEGFVSPYVSYYDYTVDLIY